METPCEGENNRLALGTRGRACASRDTMGETLKAQVKKNPGSDEALQNQLKALKRTRSTRCIKTLDGC